MQRLVHKLNMMFHAITEWLLIAAGLVLSVVALRAIDVVEVRYSILVLAVAIVVSGLYFRYRRLKKYPSQKNDDKD